MNNRHDTTEKLTDKAFSRLMITSVLGILICITCLCSATWAWFSADTASNSNTLGSGKFGLSVTVADENGAPVDVSESPTGTSACTLTEAGLYTVTLTATADTTVSKGFCVIKVNSNTYRTDALMLEETNTFTFTLDAKEPDLTVIFSPAWGLPAEISVTTGETLPISGLPTADNT